MNEARPTRARHGSHPLAGFHRRHHRALAALLAVVIVGAGAALAVPASGLTLHAGDFNVTKCGTVIDHTEVQGNVVIRAGNGHRTIYASEAAAKADACVTITDSVIDGIVDDQWTSRGYGPVFLADTTIHNPTPADVACISDANYHAWRIKVSGCRSGAQTDGYTQIHNSQLVADTEFGNAHMDALISNGNYGAPLLFDGNTFLCAPTGPVPNGAGCAADVGLFGDFSAITNVTMTNNRFKATGAAYYCLHSGYDQTKPYPNGGNINYTGNVFERGASGKCGGANAVYSWNNSAGTWCNNRWDDDGFVLATDQCQGSTTTTSSSTTTRPSSTTTSSSTSTTRATTTTTSSTSTTSTTSTTVPTTPTTEALDIHCTAPPLNCKVKP